MEWFFGILLALIASAIRIATPLLLAGLGETYSEKSGILNIGIEGIMLVGAFATFIVTNMSGSIILGVVAGVIAGVLLSLLHGFLSISVRADQTISGLALNFLALGLTSFMFLKFFGGSSELPTSKMISSIEIPLLSKIPVIGEIFFSQDIFVYFAIIATILMWVFIYRTEWGTRLKAVGEYPKAADTVGISVFKTRYIASVVNGVFSGLAGAYLIVGQLGFFMENVTSGKGYIALVAVILGRRNPFGVLIASFAIGFASALQFSLQTLGLNIPSGVFLMLPYVVTVIALLFSIGKNRDPKYLGKPYTRSER